MNSYKEIYDVLKQRAHDNAPFSLTQPEDAAHGDFATNIAFVVAKESGKSPKETAEGLVEHFLEALTDVVEKIDVAGPGFINFFLKDDVRTDEAEGIATSDITNVYGKGKVIVEYTDPNPFKIFHIGHIVPNTIGEAVARMYESEGYVVTRICYQGDVGMHVAKTVWGIQHGEEKAPKEDTPLREKVAFLGRAYAYGSSQLETDEKAKQEMTVINKAIFARSDEVINHLYDMGRTWSMDYFETMYTKLGTKFDHYIFESEVADDGVRIVKEHIGDVFTESDGAVVFKGEDVGLHTRVFINSQGLPTYEAKELGNTYKKAALVPNALRSIVVTAKEIDEYFKVIQAVLRKIDAPLGEKLTHMSHGMLRLPEGKMSSRTGNIIPAEELIDMVSERIISRLDDMKVVDEDKATLVNDIAVGAIKFAILKSAPGKDMIFDFEKSLSFEGDSGPYLQYTHARLCALLDKARVGGIDLESYSVEHPERALEQVIIGYTNVLEKAYQDLGPHHIVQYLLLLTRAFNNMYGRIQIIDESDKEKSAYYVMLSQAVKNILAHGLYTLGIKAPERM
jgi:arginyl-tRNA synthetase